MVNIQQIRAEYPEYSDMSDGDLVIGLYKKHYEDMPLNDFFNKTGIDKSVTATIKNKKAWDYYKDKVSVPLTGESKADTDKRLYGNDESNLPEMSYGRGVVQNALQGVTANLGDEIGAGLLSAGKMVTGNYKDGDYQKAKDTYNQNIERFNEKNPWTGILSQIGGGVGSAIATAPLTIASKLGQGANLASRVGANLADDAIMGGISAYGNDDNIVQGAVLSSAMGGAVRGAGGLVSGVSNKIKNGGFTVQGATNKAIDDIAEKQIMGMSDDLTDFNNQNNYQPVASNALRNIYQDAGLYSDDAINASKEKLQEFKQAGFDADLNDVSGYAYNPQATNLRGAGGNYIASQVKSIDDVRDKQAKTLLDSFNDYLGGASDSVKLGGGISKSISGKRQAESKRVSDLLQPLYNDAKYNTEADSVVGVPVQQKYSVLNEVNLDDVKNDVNYPVTALQKKNFIPNVKYPVMNFLSGKVKQGGRFARELEAMDITPKSHPRLFSKNGADSLDNLPIAEYPVIADNYGISRGNQYYNENDLIRAIGDELSGNPVSQGLGNLSIADTKRYNKTQNNNDFIDAETAYIDEMYSRVGVDDYGNPKPPVKAFSLDDKIVNRIENKFNRDAGFKTSDNRELQSPLIASELINAQKENQGMRYAGRPDYLKKDASLRNPTAEDLSVPVNSIENLHEAKKNLNYRIGKAVRDGDMVTVKDLTPRRDAIDEVLKQNPNFAQADKLFIEKMAKFEKEDLNKFGQLIKKEKNIDALRGIPKNLLSENTTVNQFDNIIKELERPVASGEKDVLNIDKKDILSVLVNDARGKIDEGQNIDSVYNALLNSESKKKKVGMLLGGKGTEAYNKFMTAMNALKNLKQTKSFYRGSPTQNKKVNEEMSDKISDVVSIASSIKSGGVTGFANVFLKNIGKLLPKSEEMTSRQAQEVMFNMFANPKYTNKNIDTISLLKNVKNTENKSNILKKKVSKASNILARSTNSLDKTQGKN